MNGCLPADELRCECRIKNMIGEATYMSMDNQTKDIFMNLFHACKGRDFQPVVQALGSLMCVIMANEANTGVSANFRHEFEGRSVTLNVNVAEIEKQKIRYA